MPEVERVTRIAAADAWVFDGCVEGAGSVVEDFAYFHVAGN